MTTLLDLCEDLIDLFLVFLFKRMKGDTFKGFNETGQSFCGCVFPLSLISYSEGPNIGYLQLCELINGTLAIGPLSLWLCLFTEPA